MPASRAPPSTPSEAPAGPEMAPVSHHLPIIVLLIIASLTIFILLCRRHSVKQRRRKVIVEQKQREYAAKLDAAVEDQPDLLDTTVPFYMSFNYKFSNICNFFAIQMNYIKYGNILKIANNFPRTLLGRHASTIIPLYNSLRCFHSFFFIATDARIQM